MAVSQSKSPSVAPEPQIIVKGLVQMSVAVSTDRVAVAQPFRLTIEVRAPESYTISPPSIGSTLGEFEATSHETVGPLVTADSEQRLRRYEYVLESLVSGTFTIPPIQVAFQTSSSSSASTELLSRPIEITVQSMLPADADPMEFRDLKGLQPTTDFEVSTSPISIVLATIVGIILAAAWFLHRRKRMITADRWAMSEIDQLENRFRASAIGIDDVYEKLSSTLRKFIEFSTGVPAQAMSSDELIRAAKHAEWPSESILTLQEFLGEVDSRKFAFRATNPNAESVADQWFERLRDLIRGVSDRSRIESEAA